MSDNPAVAISDLRKQYRENHVLNGVDLTIEHGEVFALLGPNGAGKTTTVEILGGFRRPTSGTVRVLGEDPAAAGARWRSRVGHVRQDTASFHDLTVRELVSHFATFYPNRRPADQVIAMVGLSEKSKTRAAELSGGQQRRLDIALGVVGRPELLLLDEPTTGLDPKARHQIWDLIRGLAASGTTILLTTHYMEEVEVLADRVAMLSRGTVGEIATPAQLGGRAREQARIAFRPPARPMRTPLPPRFGSAEVLLDGNGRVELNTATPTATLELLLTWARTNGLEELADLTVSRKSLEDIYLDLVADPAAPASTAAKEEP